MTGYPAISVSDATLINSGDPTIYQTGCRIGILSIVKISGQAEHVFQLIVSCERGRLDNMEPLLLVKNRNKKTQLRDWIDKIINDINMVASLTHGNSIRW